VSAEEFHERRHVQGGNIWGEEAAPVWKKFPEKTDDGSLPEDMLPWT